MGCVLPRDGGVGEASLARIAGDARPATGTVKNALVKVPAEKLNMSCHFIQNYVCYIG